MAAQISVADWSILTGRVDAAEQALRTEQEQRGQLIGQLRQEFLATQNSWAQSSAKLEELREQLNALRATLPGGAAGPAGAALLDPRLLEPREPTHPLSAEPHGRGSVAPGETSSPPLGVSSSSRYP